MYINSATEEKKFFFLLFTDAKSLEANPTIAPRRLERTGHVFQVLLRLECNDRGFVLELDSSLCPQRDQEFSDLENTTQSSNDR